MTDMKVFGIGLNKTGTTTLASCFQMLGFKHASCNLELTRCAARNELAPVFRHADKHESFEDWPWPLVYRAMDERYEGAKFILTRRVNPEKWFDSLYRHALRTGPTKYRQVAYGHSMPVGYKSSHIETYTRHNQEVREYFRNRPNKMVEICWEEGDGWDKLCSFLGLEAPEGEIPHRNKGKSRIWSMLSYLKGYVKHQVPYVGVTRE